MNHTGPPFTRIKRGLSSMEFGQRGSRGQPRRTIPETLVGDALDLASPPREFIVDQCPGAILGAANTRSMEDVADQVFHTSVRAKQHHQK